jgi:hypothetical protein
MRRFRTLGYVIKCESRTEVGGKLECGCTQDLKGIFHLSDGYIVLRYVNSL